MPTGYFPVCDLASRPDHRFRTAPGVIAQKLLVVKLCAPGMVAAIAPIGQGKGKSIFNRVEFRRNIAAKAMS
jgi:hypothetical protein